MLPKWRLLQIWLTTGVVLAFIFSGAFLWLWSSAKEYAVSSSERQITTTLSNELAEGNILRLEAALSRSQKAGILQFAEIRQFTQSGAWETVFKTQFNRMPLENLFSDFKCSSPRLAKSQFGGGVSLAVVLPGNISGSECLALYIDSDLPAGLKTLRNRLVASAILSAVIIVGLFLLYMTSLHKKIVLLETENLRAAASLSSLATQVAHDIRSPVFALEAALKNVTQLPERQRVIVRHSLNRIRDVANGLLEKNRQPMTSTSPGQTDAVEVRGSHLLSSLIEPVITEKRLQFEAKPGIHIGFDLSKEPYGLFAKVQPVEFRRMISNLVNNAVEALGEKGKVDVRLTQKDSRILLAITDDGKGIPPEILAKLGQRGETHGKASGSGLGLYHARTSAEGWGGTLSIASELDKGTTVTIELPKSEAPVYFAAEVKLVPGCPVVVLDDDPGIHELWNGRFESASLKDHNIEVFSFSEPATLRAWVKENPYKASKAICLFDYELTGHEATGLSLAEELNLCGRTILVTSRAEEKRIINACAALKVRIIPKGLADIVPIAIGGGPSLTRAVLLDDSTITQMTWEAAAEEAGAELLGYTEPDKFMADLGNFPKDMPIYIDSELGGGVKGESIAAELKEKGFTNICLATAHPPERFAHLPWLKVRSKEAPWGQDDGAV